MRATLPLGPYEPDRARYAADASNIILNARPVADGWGPLPSLETFTDALAAAPRGAFTGISPGGTTAAFAWTATAVYSLQSDGTWDDVKSGTYSLAAGDSWSADIFGPRIIATNITDGVEYWDIGSSSVFATLPGSPPNAKYVRTVGDFVVLGNISGTPNSVNWSGLNNSEQWTDGEELSGSQTFADGGAVQAILEVQGGALVFQERCIRSMRFDPQSDYPFTFTYANPTRGVVAPRSVVKIGPGDFVYLSREGFFRGLDTPIGAEKVDRTFFEIADSSEIEYVEGAADPREKIVWWRVKSVEGTYVLFAYDWHFKRWFRSDLDIQGLASMATSAVTLEDLDTLFPGGMDSVMLNTDSDALSGGTPALAGFNSSFELGYFTGVPQAATIETGTVQLTPGRRSMVRGIELVGDVGTDFSFKIGTSDYHDSSEPFGASISPSSRTGICRARKDGRMHRIQGSIASATNWTHVSAVNIDYTPSGAV